MPVAHCVLSPCYTIKERGTIGLIKMWGEYAGVSTTELTVTVVRSEQQMGKKYEAICSLQLPTLWSTKQISLLQAGLSKAIAEHYGFMEADVLVLTSVIEPGHVVEGGNEISW